MEYIFHGFNLTHFQMLDRTTVELKINVLRKHVYDCLINLLNKMMLFFPDYIIWRLQANLWHQWMS